MKKIAIGLIMAVLMGACVSPTALFQANTDDMEVPASVSFDNKSQNAEEYLWDFGDGTISSDMSPKHNYTKSGRYNITLMVKKGNKTDSHSQEMFFDAPKECLVRLETNIGTMTLLLNDETPKHRDNFIKLVKEGYYENVLFHRVISNFMIQGGDPNSKGADKNQPLGSGGPGYKVDAEFTKDLFHLRGAIAAARQGDQVNPEKKSSGSQFYIVHGNTVSPELLDRIESQKDFLYPDEVKEKYLEVGGTPFLDMDYTVFGILVEGFDVLDKIAGVITDSRDRPMEDVIILKTEIVK